jgi:hypothetical protein
VFAVIVILIVALILGSYVHAALYLIALLALLVVFND